MDSSFSSTFFTSFSGNSGGWVLHSSRGLSICNPISGNNGVRYYQAVSRICRKINEELTEDVRLLEENHPDLLGELRDVVSEEDE